MEGNASTLKILYGAKGNLFIVKIISWQIYFLSRSLIVLDHSSQNFSSVFYLFIDHIY